MSRKNIQRTPKQVKTVESIKFEVQKEFIDEGTGHDWWHIQRVLNMARRITQEEEQPVNMFVIDLSALLHDIADWKFHSGDDTVGPNKAREIMQRYHIEEAVINQVTDTIEKISFKGAGVESKPSTLEGQIVQDADRLDALGAIGIARAFAYGGYKEHPIHDPELAPVIHQSFADYQQGTTTINHFYEKLLLLRDRMNTPTGRRIAEERHHYIEGFLERFNSEWVGKL